MVFGNLLGALEGPELLIILALVLVLFGGSKLPKLARSLGQAKKEFQAGTETPVDTEAEETTAPTDTVTISQAELDRLRRAAGQAEHS